MSEKSVKKGKKSNDKNHFLLNKNVIMPWMIKALTKRLSSIA